MALVITLLILIVPFVLTRLATPRFSELLIAGGAVRKNYTGKMIPTAAGLSIVGAVAVTYLLAAILWEGMRLEILAALVVVLGMGFLGFIDDLLGTRDTTGIKGHLSMLVRGKITTGGLKALGGAGFALGFSLLFGKNLVDICVNTLLIALFTNAVNLTDLRPGRADKTFLILGFCLITAGILYPAVPNRIFLLLPAMGAVAAFLPYDLKGQVMLGDTGSNALGIILGIVSVLMLNIIARAVLLFLLILLHIYTEKYSLTETIEKIRILRCIDEWGRP